MEILKADKIKHEITACVYCADGEKDSQGDFISPDDRDVLEKAEEEFLKAPKFNIDHDEGQTLEGLKILESYITDTDEKIGSKVVGAGCWIIKIAVPDALYNDLEKGNGISMQGDAEFLTEED